IRAPGGIHLDCGGNDDQPDWGRRHRHLQQGESPDWCSRLVEASCESQRGRAPAGRAPSPPRTREEKPGPCPVRTMIARFMREESGQDMVEYALLAAFFGVAGYLALNG